jgi:hypothetical protein
MWLIKIPAWLSCAVISSFLAASIALRTLWTSSIYRGFQVGWQKKNHGQVDAPPWKQQLMAAKPSLGCQLIFWLARHCVELEKHSIWSFSLPEFKAHLMHAHKILVTQPENLCTSSVGTWAKRAIACSKHCLESHMRLTACAFALWLGYHSKW